MEITGVQIFLLVIIAAVVGMGSVLDSFQTHRPLIACTLVGIILGDVTTGVILGGTLEFIALGWMNIGAAQSPDSALASIISTILVIVGSQSIGTGIAIALPVAAAGQVLTVIARTVTVFFQHAADRYAEDANFRMIDICHVSALAVQALRVAVPAFLVAVFASPEGIQAMMGGKYLRPFLYLGFVVAAFTSFNLVAFGVIGTVLAIIYVQLNPRFAAPQTVAAAPASVADDELED